MQVDHDRGGQKEFKFAGRNFNCFLFLFRTRVTRLLQSLGDTPMSPPISLRVKSYLVIILTFEKLSILRKRKKNVFVVWNRIKQNLF